MDELRSKGELEDGVYIISDMWNLFHIKFIIRYKLDPIYDCLYLTLKSKLLCNEEKIKRGPLPLEYADEEEVSFYDYFVDVSYPSRYSSPNYSPLML